MNDKLENWRKQIDITDEKIITFLAKRMLLAKKIGKLKKAHNIPVIDKDRQSKILNSQVSRGKELGLSKYLIKALYSLIHKYSIKTQKKSI